MPITGFNVLHFRQIGINIVLNISLFIYNIRDHAINDTCFTIVYQYVSFHKLFTQGSGRENSHSSQNTSSGTGEKAYRRQVSQSLRSGSTEKELKSISFLQEAFIFPLFNGFISF